MRLAGLIVGAVAMCGAAQAQTPPQASEVMHGLGGYCWEADLGEGVTDTHCFSIARNGHLVMDVHKVRSRSSAVVYEGVTLYRLEPESGVVRYDYFNSNGQVMTGYAKRDGSRIRFPEKADQDGDVVWYLGPDAYEVGIAATNEARRKFVNVGPAPPGGF